MKRIYIGVAIALATALAVAAIALRPSETQPASWSSVDAGEYFDQSAATDQRIRALEAAVAEERNARQLLEDELLVLFSEMDALRAEDTTDDEDEDNDDAEADDSLDRRAAARNDARRRFQRGHSDDDGRTAALLDVGFSPDRADWIMRREDELRLEALQARFEAQRSGDMQAMFNANSSSESQLRTELGDTDYEQYLEAYGRPTSVTVSSILDSSPGQRAGLQPGDQIVGYDGQRVFSYSDLNNQQLQGSAGESVVVDLLRDGVPIQIVLPRGPIGIQAGRFGRR